MRSKKCGQIIEEALLCLIWTISTHSKAPAAAAVVPAASSHGFSWSWPYFGSSENYLDKTQPQGASSFLGVPFCLCSYKQWCRVTVTDLRLQNLECGYNSLAATVAPPQIVSISEPFSKSPLKSDDFRGLFYSLSALSRLWQLIATIAVSQHSLFWLHGRWEFDR